jgi:hypothetical protein
MATCPTCGSTDIHPTSERAVNVGRAAVGWALFGGLGGAVGAMTGKDKFANYCTECGSTWDAETIYNIKKVLRDWAEIELDFSQEQHRKFFGEILPFIQTQNRTQNEQGSEEATRGCLDIGCGFFLLFGPVAILSAVIHGKSDEVFPVLIFVGVALGYFLWFRRTFKIVDNDERKRKAAGALSGFIASWQRTNGPLA